MNRRKASNRREFIARALRAHGIEDMPYSHKKSIIRRYNDLYDILEQTHADVDD